VFEVIRFAKVETLTPISYCNLVVFIASFKRSPCVSADLKYASIKGTPTIVPAPKSRSANSLGWHVYIQGISISPFSVYSCALFTKQALKLVPVEAEFYAILSKGAS
jgi:hypothetical protein